MKKIILILAALVATGCAPAPTAPDQGTDLDLTGTFGSLFDFADQLVAARAATRSAAAAEYGAVAISVDTVYVWDDGATSSTPVRP